MGAEPGRLLDAFLQLVGDSLIMVTPDTARDPLPGFLYVYVDDADTSYARAVAAGAITIEAPLDTATAERWCATRSATSFR